MQVLVLKGCINYIFFIYNILHQKAKNNDISLFLWYTRIEDKKEVENEKNYFIYFYINYRFNGH